ncbi:MAG TPA: hypothetical protein VGR73_01920 [Bryobacteraceae bacterium]|nr:hypothetical protein [Bryobacteraceae bacterium]
MTEVQTAASGDEAGESGPDASKALESEPKPAVAKRAVAKRAVATRTVARRKAAAKKTTPAAKTGTAEGAASRDADAKAQITVVRKLLKTVEQKLSGKDAKASLGDYIRLVQLEKELDDEAPREIKVTWVETGTPTTEPKPETAQVETTNIDTTKLDTAKLDSTTPDTKSGSGG